MCTMSARMQDAPESGELGESKVSPYAAPATRQGVLGVCLCPLLLGQGWAVAACWDHCTCNTRFPSTASSNAPQPAGQAQSRTLGTALGDTWPCQVLTAFVLSSSACMLCGQIDADPSICGPKHMDFGICAHAFCAMFSTSLLQKARILNRIVVLHPEDIRHTIQQAEQKCCFICGKRGASITCAEIGCERSFHLPCTLEGECVSQHFGKYSSFCQEHSPQQAVEAAPEQDTSCIICLEPVEDKKSYSTMVCPACKHAWFHRACIQVGGLLSPCRHGSTRPCSHSCCVYLCCRDRQRAQALTVSSALSAETKTNLNQKCSSWGSESQSENQRGRTTTPTQHWETGTGAAMSASASIHEAGSRQKERDPGSCSCAAPVQQKAPTDTAPI
ncbi:uncharacterized protein LOC110394125 isoform X3 [Numida meleagris]|uniref:uncharacterized protein LOC110394125 isoform X3 n=1 Tax=Numida meleagris TaxID=8996 RepID=UPI000B3DF9BA|nr:uncharacterized protein LOC110394125 isoform X3 [Numida meleagris]